MAMLNVSPELYQELAKLAEAKGVAANELAESVLGYYLKDSTAAITKPLSQSAIAGTHFNSNPPELVEKIARMLGKDLPPELSQEILALPLQDDKTVLQAALNRLPTKRADSFRLLNQKQQKKGQASLTVQELRTLEELRFEYDRYILTRTYAALVLKERGYDISGLGPLE